MRAWARLTPPGIAATAALAVPILSPRILPASRPPGIAATAAWASQPKLFWPASRPRNRGDRGPGGKARDFNRAGPPHAPRNRGDCGATRLLSTYQPSPPHAPRNRGDCGTSGGITGSIGTVRLTPPGIAATAAERTSATAGFNPPASRPPESRRLRLGTRWVVYNPHFRLTPPGIAATAAGTLRGRR